MTLIAKAGSPDNFVDSGGPWWEWVLLAVVIATVAVVILSYTVRIRRLRRSRDGS